MDGIEIKLLMSFMTSSGRKVSLFVRIRNSKNR